MSLFDIFSGKKRREKREGLDLLKSVIQYQIEASTDGVMSDEIPKAYGPFGLCSTNPIPTTIRGWKDYLSDLRTTDGDEVESVRLGSTSALDVTSGMIDIYKISVMGNDYATIYICPYHKKISTKAPAGFKFRTTLSPEGEQRLTELFLKAKAEETPEIIARREKAIARGEELTARSDKLKARQRQ